MEDSKKPDDDDLDPAEILKSLDDSAAQPEASDAEAAERASFYTPGASGKGGALGGLSFFKKHRKALAGGGVGVVGLILAGISLFGFLNAFKLDHILRNIESKTLARFNATLSGRSDAWVKSYIRVRMLQYTGKYTADADGNLFFRAASTGPNLTFRDWYRSVYTSNFEKDLWQKDGVAFSSMLDKDGKPQVAKLILKGDTLDFNPQTELSPKAYEAFASGDQNRAIGAINLAGNDIDKYLDKQIFNSPKQARKDLKKVISDRTHFWQVIKRRHIRKNIQSMIGLRKWRFFENLATKYQSTKYSMQKKIIASIFPDSSKLGAFVQCIFVGTCNSAVDYNNPDNTPALIDPNLDSGTAVDPATNKETTLDLGGSDLANLDQQAIQEVNIATDAAKAAEASAPNATVKQRLIQQILQKFLGDEIASDATGVVDPTKWWRLAKKIAALDRLVRKGTLSKMVQKMRLDQFMALYAAFGIARDQLKSSGTQGAEVQDFMNMTNGFENSEGWNRITTNSSGVVSAASTTPDLPISKTEYCKSGHERLRTEFAWFCDDEKPNSGGGAKAFENAYSASIGYITGPIAVAVNSIKSIPIIGSVVDAFTSFANKITGAIASITIQPLLKITGFGSQLGKVMAFVTDKLLSFLGAAPIFTGPEPGVANYLMAGSAGTAENSTRFAGGIASTTVSLNYSNQLASNFQKEQLQDSSVFERYLALDNPDSVASTSLFSFASGGVSKSFTSFITNIASLPKLFGSIFSGRTFAQTEDTSSTTAQWAGVDTYDIPQQCMDLDPLDPDYVTKATNAWTALGIPASYEVLNNSTAFWAAVYGKISGDTAHKEQVAGTIYNCASLDKQVRGGLGALYGYTNDDGLNDDSSQPAAPSGGYNLGTLVPGDTTNIPCQAGTEDLGAADGYSGGALTKIRLCGLPNLASSGEESTPGTAYYVAGANGHGIVNSQVSGAFLAMVTAAKISGINISAYSTFRTMAHQTALCKANASCANGVHTAVAQPGYSNHQMGYAIDFVDSNHVSLSNCVGTHLVAGVCVAPGDPTWEWLDQNAENFGFKQYVNESWHWSPTGN